MKVMTIVGTRPELIKLCRVIAALDAGTQHVLVHTGQNYDYELNQVFFDELGVRRPDHFLEAAGPTPAQTIGNVIIRADAAIERERPEALLLLGDTNSCLAVIAAKRRKVPVFHMEAGNRCFDERVPEELNRKLVDHASDINLTYTEHARRYLVAEGKRPETVIKTGSPMREVLATYAQPIAESQVLTRLALERKGYFLVSAHREENVDSPQRLRCLLSILQLVAQRYRTRIVFSAHPRTRERLSRLGEEMPAAVELMKPFGFFDYMRLQSDAICTLSDSGTLTEESSIVGFPAVMLRDAHERPEGMDEAAVVMAGLNPERVLDAIESTVRSYEATPRPFAVPSDYSADNVSAKVLRIILSYTDYVRRTVWFEQVESDQPRL
jgi:UDP-N-acetylglucosamine 2-epimerase (non-hydrolysing)